MYRLRAAESGDYAFCIDNSFSHFTNKVVFFELYSAADEEEDETLAGALEEADYDFKLEDFKVTY